MFNLHYAATSMMMSQILEFVDFTKTQKSRCLENETFFLQIKFNNYTSMQKNTKAKKLLYGKKYFYSGGNF